MPELMAVSDALAVYFEWEIGQSQGHTNMRHDKTLAIEGVF
jgi:hypothetical protein